MTNPTFEDLERARAALLRAVEAVPPERRAARLAPDRWSLLELTEHLWRLEAGLLATARAGEHPEVEVNPRFEGLMQAMRSMGSFKTLPLAEPTESLPLDELERRWNETRARLGAHLRAGRADAWVLRHPLAGDLTLAQFMMLVDAHLHHHRPQLDALLSGPA